MAEHNDPRPLSPHIWNWKWHVTMATSIFHRASGVALYVGAFLLAGWLIALASGEDAFEAYTGIVGSPLGLIVLFLMTAALMYHFANGIRHLIWDAGKGYEIGTANMTAWVSIGFAAIATLAIWAYILTQVMG